jgi:two-component system response regulator MprA
MHILIVDDDEDIREVFGLILRAEGHKVEEAADGLQALTQLRAGCHPDVILLDMMMPRLDGEALMKLIRADSHLTHIPVVIISGHHAARQKAFELGAEGCLVKPIDLDELSVILQHATEQRAAVR